MFRLPMGYHATAASPSLLLLLLLLSLFELLPPCPVLQIELGLDSTSDEIEERIERTIQVFTKNYDIIVLGIQRPNGDGNNHGRVHPPLPPLPPRQAGTMLFDKLLDKCRDEVYDPIYGTFLPKTHPLVVRASQLSTSAKRPPSPLIGGPNFTFVRGKNRAAAAAAAAT